MYDEGHRHAFQAGQTLLIETRSDVELAPPLRQLVRLLGFGDPAGPWAIETVDTAFPISASPGPAPRPITRIAWIADDAIVAARDLASTRVIGNIVPATQGQTVSERFAIAAGALPTPGQPPLAIERAGVSPTGGPDDRPVVRMWTLANAPLAWLAAADAASAVPEIRLASDDGVIWAWRKTLLESKPMDSVFTLDCATYRALPVNSDGSIAYEYDSDGGDTLRLGDGVFGVDPQPGQTFVVTYRAGAGAAANVAADAINQIDVGQASPFASVTNPFAAFGGVDAETLLSVRRSAPQAFHVKMLRAVTDDDYVAATRTLPWVERAGCARRWTGSWLTAFVTPEPASSEIVLTGQRQQLITLLDSMRMAGVEVYAPDPHYVAIDLRIELCVAPEAFAAQVQQAVTAAVAPAGAGSSDAFFAVGRFGFGQPLYRGDLEAAIQAVPGVAGVTRITYRLRDRWLGFQDMGNAVAVGPVQILRCDNDKSRPAAGALSVTAGGGR
jgi:predicted phage baseplate assembly protein